MRSRLGARTATIAHVGGSKNGAPCLAVRTFHAVRTGTLRESRGGKWVSVTLVIEATSKAQLDAIYRELSAHEKVVWAI